jgi:hypothetical protein
MRYVIYFLWIFLVSLIGISWIVGTTVLVTSSYANSHPMLAMAFFVLSVSAMGATIITFLKSRFH